MSALLPRLLQLSRSGRTQDEDFLTEVFASVVRHYPALLHPLLADRRVSVQTQVYWPALPFHEISSRPDLVVRTMDGDEHDSSVLIAVECKLDAAEGLEQLSRYGDHLYQQISSSESQWHAHLIYLTRDADPKPDPESCKENVRFHQMRWYQVYRAARDILQSNTSVQLLPEFVSLMETLELDQSRRLVPEDLIAMSRFRPLFRMMSEVLTGSVRTAIAGAFGSSKLSLPDGIQPGQLLKHNRYIIWSGHMGLMSGLAGFDFSTRGYPSAVIQIEYHGDEHERVRRILMEQASIWSDSETTWEPLMLPHMPHFTAIYLRRGLEKVLPEGDHVAELERFFVAHLDRIREFRAGAGSDLPWAD